MTKIKTLIVRFTNPIKRTEITQFRGAVIASISQDCTLFHNHEGQKLRYAYPLIQYKRIGGQAAMVCVEEGADHIGKLFQELNHKALRIGNREEYFAIDNIQAHQTEIQCWNNKFVYRLRDWLPLNEHNYNKYQQCESLIEKIQLLEQILIGNILSFAKGIQLQIEKPIEVNIKNIENTRLVKYKHTALECIDIQFKSNISLPPFIGLGKHSSVGFGILTKKANS